MILLENFLPALFLFKLQQQVGDPPDLPKVGVLHFPYGPRVRVGGSNFRGAFVGRRPLHRLLQDGLSLRLASLHMPLQDMFQKVARPLPRLPFRRGDTGISLITLFFDSIGILVAFLWLAGIRR